jgi:hypothetical protein
VAGKSDRERASRAREKSERLARYADQWERGAEGESQTAAVLRELGPLWTVWHDLKWPGRRFANIDHLVIGPGGIFVIDSKNWTGAVAVKDGVLRQNGYRRESAVAGCADAALAVGELLPQYIDRVRPVLCLIRDESVEGWARDVMLCSTVNVVPMLLTRPKLMAPDEIADAVMTLQARMNSMEREPRPHLPTAARPHPSRARAARPSRRLSRPVRLVLGLVLRMAFMLMVIAFGIMFIRLLPDLLVSIATPPKPKP